MPSFRVDAVDIRAMAQLGMTKLRGGDARAAREAFDKIVAAREADASIYLALAIACQQLNDQAGMHIAIEAALAREPQNLRTLMMKADYCRKQGDERASNNLAAPCLCV